MGSRSRSSMHSVNGSDVSASRRNTMDQKFEELSENKWPYYVGASALLGPRATLRIVDLDASTRESAQFFGVHRLFSEDWRKLDHNHFTWPFNA